ncbi:MAG TPA: aldehyde dehydrogenase (NADP(+)), partial [Cytophagales bacterium]|nr:aldehyde dehydrogenase (NADP(+)) [Cytophagales bacterium]
NQLRLFAQVVCECSWVEATLDTADPGRAPLPKPDVRKMLVGLGPVVVFTASNFPLAFSVAGGDTASALAAGCPVIVKAHEAHLGTNELVAKAVRDAAQKTGMPEGVFSSLNGDGFKTGQQLVNHPEVKAVAFTGSHRGGMALYRMAQNRKEPIPVFAEMGSINPVVLCPQALEVRTEAIATTYAGSITLGVGQFCTNPGLLIGISSPALERFKSLLTEGLNAAPTGSMLTEGIAHSFARGKQAALTQAGVTCLTDDAGTATLAMVVAREFMDNPTLHQEIFGPMSLLVECETEAELLAVVSSLEGQLTGTLMAEPADQALANQVAQALQRRVGRVIYNGAPTGVEVGHAMHHGGPFPA